MRNVGRLIADNSIEAPSSTNLMQGALAGMANAVGDAPYTAYLPPQDQEEYLRDMDGQYAGVGMANFVKDAASGEFYFVPIANSPASDAGLKFGDRLVAIDGRNVDETSLLVIYGFSCYYSIYLFLKNSRRTRLSDRKRILIPTSAARKGLTTTNRKLSEMERTTRRWLLRPLNAELFSRTSC